MNLPRIIADQYHASLTMLGQAISVCPDDLWADVVGQDAAVAQLRAAATSPVHAYLLVGPEGSGTREATLGLLSQLEVSPPVLNFGTLGAVVAAAREGLGVTLVHADAVATDLESGRLEKLSVRGTEGRCRRSRLGVRQIHFVGGRWRRGILPGGPPENHRANRP